MRERSSETYLDYSKVYRRVGDERPWQLMSERGQLENSNLVEALEKMSHNPEKLKDTVGDIETLYFIDEQSISTSSWMRDDYELPYLQQFMRQQPPTISVWPANFHHVRVRQT